MRRGVCRHDGAHEPDPREGDAEERVGEEQQEDIASQVVAEGMSVRATEELVRGIVERQYQGVLKNHDRIRDLRDQYRASA